MAPSCPPLYLPIHGRPPHCRRSPLLRLTVGQGDLTRPPRRAGFAWQHLGGGGREGEVISGGRKTGIRFPSVVQRRCTGVMGEGRELG
jgi:hypothetical protein